jgi:dipeptidyl aminopeptidase/acylaminoacyl peptidase
VTQSEKTIPPGDNLVVEEIPAIPAPLAERAGRYTEFRMAAFMDWHPTRREMLVSTRFGETGQVHHVAAPRGARRQVTFFPDTVRGATFDAAHGDYVVFNKDTGGDEFAQNWRLDLGTGEVTLLTDGASQNSLGVWSTAKDRMAYTSIRRTGKDRDLYLIDPADPASDRCIAELSGGGWSPQDWSPDDTQLLVIEYVSVNESYLWLMGSDGGGEKTLLTPKGGAETVSYGMARFAPDGKSLYVTTDRGGEFPRLARLEITTGEHTSLTDHISWGVEGFDLSPDGAQIAFTTNEDGRGLLHLLDTATGQEMALPPLPAGLISGAVWHPQGRHLAFNVTSAGSPFDVYSLDTETGNIERWTESETGGLNTASWAEPDLVRWPSFDGRSISGFLYRPPAKFAGRRPVIVNIHGGPESQFRPSYLGRASYYIQEMGAAVLYPNVRGSSGYGKTFLSLDNGFLREDSYKDITALLDWIGTQSDLDAERIMITGGSYGGHMTFAVATRDNDRIRCALPIVGMSNLVTFLENTEGYRQDLRRVEYGDERDPEMRAFLERIAPLNHARNIIKPLFIVQGRNDPRVPYTEALQMAETVRSNGGPVWFLMANDEGHGFIKKSNADFQFYATILFIRQFLLG